MHALILGVSGQDGYYLAKHLRNKGLEVTGTTRLLSIKNQIDYPGINFIGIDYKKTEDLKILIKKLKPSQIYNLGGISSVAESYEKPIETLEANYYSVIRIWDFLLKEFPNTKFFQCSSSEMFGNQVKLPISETAILKPISPYGVSKAKTHEAANDYINRGLHISRGILFNHESPRRSSKFVTQKIISGLHEIKINSQEKIVLGDINIERDWGYAKDYAIVMDLILSKDIPNDYVIATGEKHSLKDFIEIATKEFGILKDINEFLHIDSKLIRPNEILSNFGDPTKIKKNLNWEAKIRFKELIALLVQENLRQAIQN